MWFMQVASGRARWMLAGVYPTLHPMQHQYNVTDDTPEISERETAHPHVMDPAGESYLRQEGRGLCIGFYEQPCRLWAVDGGRNAVGFVHELFLYEFNKIAQNIEFKYK
jgi:dimethylglycine dehydrogenase